MCILSDKRLDPCEGTPCMNGGICHSNTTAFTYNCTCSTDYTGKDCETGTCLLLNLILL